MFIYVKYEDGVKEAVSVDRIVNLDIKKIDFEKKYKIEWKDGNFYNGIIGKIQGKPISAASKEEVEKEANGKRVEFAPLTLCDTATDLETDSELERSCNLKSATNLEERIETKLLKIQNNENINKNPNKTSDDNKIYRKDKESTCNKENKSNITNIVGKTDTKKNLNMIKDSVPLGKLVTTSKSNLNTTKIPLSVNTKNKEKQHNSGSSNNAKQTINTTKKITESMDYSFPKEETTYGSNAKKKIEKLEKEKEHLLSQKMKLEKQLQDKETLIADLMTLNINLQKKVIAEYTEISKINKEIGKKVLSNFDELLHVVSEYFKQNPICLQEQVGLPPVGYENKERNEVHLGFDVYIPKSSYDSVLVISKTIPQLIKNVAVAVFGIKVFKESTVTGIVSNRKKKIEKTHARPALDPTKLKAIRATVKHYLMTKRNIDEISIDIELQNIGLHISHKICDLNRNESVSSRKQEMKAALYITMDDTNTSDEIHTNNICEVSQTSNDKDEKNVDEEETNVDEEKNNVDKEKIDEEENNAIECE